MANKKTQKEPYIKLLNHILSIRGIRDSEKNLLAHIYSFGEKGCWQSNKTLAEIFMTSPATISRRIANIKQFIYIKNPKGYYRTMWARSHPQVKAAAQLWYKGQKIGNPDKQTPVDFRKNAEHPTQKCSSQLIKSAIRLNQKCATTNNTTITETIKETIATPPPLPAGGQASALLADRGKQAKTQIEEFKKRFGLGKKGRKSPLLTREEFEARRQAQIKALLGITADTKTDNHINEDGQ